MGKSYKKMPILKDPYDKKWVKRQASKSIRRYKLTISNRGAYKKIFDSWDINDYIFYKPWNVRTEKEYQEDGVSKSDWAKWYLRK